jgi:putative endonuclease
VKPLAAEAEQFVAESLAGEGWTIAARNWRSGPGEIDIIAIRDGTAAFVEVKLALDSGRTLAAEKIDAVKRSRLTGAAAMWIAGCRWGGGCRFDVAIVRGLPGRMRIEYLEDAFRPGGRTYTV